MTEETILRAEDVVHRYEDHPVLDGVDIHVNPGESVAICGRSGVGKTTLLEIIGTMRTPTSGLVEIQGKRVYNMSVSDRAQLRGRSLGFVFQDGHLLPDLSVWENCRLAVSLSPRDWSRERIRERFRSLMDTLDMDPDRGEDRPGQFSSGERQRVAVVRALIHDPALLVADEPTGNLDPRTSDRLLDLLLPLLEERGMGILVATHDRDLAQSLQSIHVLKDGNLGMVDADEV